MNLDPLEAEVLGWLLDDVEAPQTLAGDISREFGSSVSEASISSALTRLVEMGLAQAFEFDQATNSFRSIATRNPSLTAWFMVTKAGCALADKMP
jgi:hypothetical protein